MVKKSAISDLPGPSAQTFRLVNVNEGDKLGWVSLTDGKKEVLLATALGMAIRFSEEEVRPMGLAAAGVSAIKLGVGDEVVGMETLPQVGDVFLMSSDGKGKRVEVKDFPVQGRYGKGVIAWEMPRGTRLTGLGIGKPNAIVTLHLLKAAAKQARLDEAPLRKRSASRGGQVVDVKPGDAVVGLTEGWAVERYVTLLKNNENGRKPAPGKNGTGKPAASKRNPGKKRPAKKKPAATKKVGPGKKKPAAKKPAGKRSKK
jgi:DNA gyrase/topoisomerase IV subunit A